MKSAGTKKELSAKDRAGLFGTLQARFEKNMNRHKGLEWAKVQARLEANAGKLWSLHEMEKNRRRTRRRRPRQKDGRIPLLRLFAGESERTGRGLLRPGRARFPQGIQTENQRHRHGHRHGGRPPDRRGISPAPETGRVRPQDHDLGETPAEIRKLGGALFGDRRYGRVFICHNGAQSYYGARGFRASLKV